MAGAYDFHVPDPLDGGSESAAGSDRLTAPMPGLIKLVRVEAGDVVSKGEALIVMEAMKMELTLSASRDGIVEACLSPRVIRRRTAQCC